MAENVKPAPNPPETGTAVDIESAHQRPDISSDPPAPLQQHVLSITIFGQKGSSIDLDAAKCLLAAKTGSLRTCHWLSDRVLSIIRLPPPGLPPASVLRKDPEVAKFEAEHHVEIVLHIHRTPVWIAKQFVPIKLAVFDMDSTLIEQEVIDELAASVNAGPVVATITRRAMEGKIDFEQSLRERVALLKGVPTQIWDDLKHKITFADGARDLCKVLKVLQVKMAVLSGGFIQMANWAKDELGLDHAHANHLLTNESSGSAAIPHLSGLLNPTQPVITASKKRRLLLSFAKEYDISLSEVLCVGDGANDLEMLNEVGNGGGLGIAFKAKPKVQEMAPQKLNSNSLTDILYLLNFKDDDIRHYLEVAQHSRIFNKQSAA